MNASKNPSTRGGKPGLWRCPRCGERFTSRNQWHACGSYEIEALFAGSQPVVRRLYDRFLEVVRESGPVTVIPQKTRVALQVRMRFAALVPQKSVLKGHLVLARRRPSARFESIESLSSRNHVHVFRLRSVDELDPGFRDLIAEAYRAGTTGASEGAGRTMTCGGRGGGEGVQVGERPRSALSDKTLSHNTFLV